MPTFCRHNRFIERCPICSKTLPGGAPSMTSKPRASGSARRSASGEAPPRRRARGVGVRIHREGRAADDGYRCELVPGLRASSDAMRLAEELAFSHGRLRVLALEPPGLYGDARTVAASDLERASWMCFLIVYLCPLEDGDPFAGIRLALTRGGSSGSGAQAWREGEPPDLDGVPLGPRTCHDPARGADTLIAYRQWVARTGGAGASAPESATGGLQAVAYGGDPAWSPQRRFDRVFERIALPGFGRLGRYDLLVTLGHLGLYELRAQSLNLAGAAGLSAEDPTTLAAKRLFAIADPLLLERRAAALAEACSLPIETLDLALANWLSPRRASMGCPAETFDEDAFERAGGVLGL
jgi:hypothetical protein